LEEVQLSPKLTASQLTQLKRLLGDSIKAFSLGPMDLGRTSVLSHDIITEGGPVKQYAH
jgi:hypothetical protein